MAPIVAYHATSRNHRESIRRLGLLPNQPTRARPYGVYVYRDDGGCNHPAWESAVYWECHEREDCWRVAYIGPLRIDQYVLNGLILLDRVEHVTLVTGNHAD